ncbi:hypothetical protein X975_13272, partial [Stegodyphus mimosarum]
MTLWKQRQFYLWTMMLICGMMKLSLVLEFGGKLGIVL